MSFLYDNFWDDCIEKKKKPIKKNLRNENIRNKILKATNLSFDLGNFEISINSSCENQNINKKKKSKSLSSRNIHFISNKKPKINNLKKNNTSLNTIELNFQKQLKECTFKPKILKLKNNSKIKNKIDSYIKEPYYKRFKLFTLKQKNFEIKNVTKNELSFNSKYSFKPIIHPCLDFNKIRLNQRNEELNYIYYKKMEWVRNQKRKLKEELSTKYIYYGENLILKNYNDCKTIHKNTSNKIRKSLSQKDTMNCINYLHSQLMKIKSNIDDNDKNELFNQTEIKNKVFKSFNLF
jgi:hypothetical protein